MFGDYIIIKKAAFSQPSLLYFHRLIDGLCELVGTGGGLIAASVASQRVGSPLGIGTLQELGDGLQVSWTALCETDIVQLTVLNVEVDLLGAYSHWDIRIMCHIA